MGWNLNSKIGTEVLTNPFNPPNSEIFIGTTKRIAGNKNAPLTLGLLGSSPLPPQRCLQKQVYLKCKYQGKISVTLVHKMPHTPLDKVSCLKLGSAPGGLQAAWQFCPEELQQPPPGLKGWLRCTPLWCDHKVQPCAHYKTLKTAKIIVFYPQTRDISFSKNSACQ